MLIKCKWDLYVILIIIYMIYIFWFCCSWYCYKMQCIAIAFSQNTCAQFICISLYSRTRRKKHIKLNEIVVSIIIIIRWCSNSLFTHLKLVQIIDCIIFNSTASMHTQIWIHFSSETYFDVKMPIIQLLLISLLKSLNLLIKHLQNFFFRFVPQ